uniref:Transmembrane protein n=1 Tax=Steinernema glaseri TaxID=37863 RepID=A0A1I8AU77_9BILA
MKESPFELSDNAERFAITASVKWVYRDPITLFAGALIVSVPAYSCLVCRLIARKDRHVTHCQTSTGSGIPRRQYRYPDPCVN